MSLQGTLETIPLADVLSLLAATKKTGELRVGGARGDGRLWLDAGKVVGADVPRAATPVDAVFELLRLTAGTFSFEDDAAAPAPGVPLAVDALLGEAQGRLDAWRAIEAVVPSMACLVTLAPELAEDSVTVSRQQWKHLVAVAGGGDVNGVMERLGLGEFDSCRTVKELVDAGLAKVAPAPVVKAPEPASTPPRAPGRPDGTPAAAAPSRPASAARTAAAPAAAAPSAPVPAASTPRARTPESPSAASPRRLESLPAQVASSRPAPAPVTRPEPARRPAVAPPSREEADELVHQLASLSKTPPAPRPPSAKGEEAAEGPSPEEPAAPPRTGDDGSQTAAGRAEEEPINRGMLLKFLSSVRP